MLTMKFPAQSTQRTSAGCGIRQPAGRTIGGDGGGGGGGGGGGAQDLATGGGGGGGGMQDLAGGDGGTRVFEVPPKPPVNDSRKPP